MKKLLVFFTLPLVLFGQRADTTYQRVGILAKLPVFTSAQLTRLTYPDSWLTGRWNNFTEWKQHARTRVFETMLALPPNTPFNPVVLGEEDRGSYTAQKVVVSITADSRVLGYLLVPKGHGPFPAVLLLHDHGARFDIGKEKMIKPFENEKARCDTSQIWVNLLYGGRFIGDELAHRGYVCFATDALNWGDRGGAGYDDQQALASNLFNLGMSYAGLVAWEDIRAAEFLASLPFVDSTRIAAIGFSFGSFRTWQLAALSDRIACGVAVCWMGTIHGLMQPGNNRTRGQSAFSSTHPGLANYLDFPDVASIACPKPMLFMNGTKDKLFPLSAVKEAYEKMNAVWNSQGARSALSTELWDVGHVFNAEMQNHAFQWLDMQLLPK
ncbi:MAG: dienelactone hydrolase family protein [Bacteroidetes bacterium]|nr:dienelactone hydrolase family protein [Bacteroidota bacterium]